MGADTPSYQRLLLLCCAHPITQTSKRLPPQRELSCAPRMTEDTPHPRTSAAALSAAVDSTKSIGDAPDSQAEPTPKKHPNPSASRSSGGEREGGASLREAASLRNTPHVRGGSVSRRGLNQVYRKRAQLSGGTNSEETSQPERQPLFGREREGGASLREAACPRRTARIAPTSLQEGARGRALLAVREAPSRSTLVPQLPYLRMCAGATVYGGRGALRAWARDRRAAENLPASVDQDIAPLRPRCRCHGQPRKQRSVNVGSRSCKSPLTAGYASMTTVMHRRESAA